MQGQPLRRRDVLTGLGALGLTSTIASAAPAGAGVPAPDVASEVRRRAIALARAAFVPPVERLPPAMAAMGYDEYRDLRFRPERAVWHGQGLGFELQFFPAAYIYRSPVEIYLVEQGSILPVAAARGLFDFSLQDHRVSLNAPLSFSGFRIHAPLNAPGIYDEFMVFQGSSYFRGLGKGHSYGLSARGLAIGTGSSRPEEFPLFRAFWIERPRHAQSITVHALLDSPSVTGAYSFQIWPGAETRMDIAAELFPRRDLTEVGLAPLTSMFLKDTHDDDGPADFRPAVHDSDGLAVWNARGERLWRPLVSPRQVQNTTLLDDNLRGFGLIQRARSFAAYEDLEANYHKRPSAWVEPRKTLFGRVATIAGFVEADQSPLSITHPPLRGSARRAAHLAADRPRGDALGRQNNNPRPLTQTMLRLRRARQAFELGALRVRQNDRGRFMDTIHRNLESRLTKSR